MSRSDQSVELKFVVTNTLIVRDIPRSVAFYRNVLGATAPWRFSPPTRPAELPSHVPNGLPRLVERFAHSRDLLSPHLPGPAHSASDSRPSRLGRWCLARSLFVAATSRTFARWVCVLPNLSNSPSCKTRSSFGWSSSGMSAISSKKRVPGSAASKRPTLRSTAPVKAPLSWPKSSLSNSPTGMAAQFSVTKR
jgi:hypothetical protein